MASEEDLRASRRAHGERLRELDSMPFPNDFRVDGALYEERKRVLSVVHNADGAGSLPQEDELTGDEAWVPLFGRVVAKRGPFLVIRTPHGDAQALVRKESLPDRAQQQLKTLDLADHASVTGPLIRTKTGAAAVSARTYRHVGKALLPPPAKWHGLRDVEKRYRERYVDLANNPEVAEVFRARSTLVQSLRSFLDGEHFVEVETPLLHPIRGGATAKPFVTHHRALDLNLFLRVAPELYLKRLLVGGLERVYEIGRCFRNEGLSTRHNPEFTLLEFYRAYSTCDDLMDMTEGMLRGVNRRLLKAHPGVCEGRRYDLEADWVRVSMRDVIVERLRRAGHGAVSPSPWSSVLGPDDLRDGISLDSALQRANGHVPEGDMALVNGNDTYGRRVFALYELLAEPELAQLYRTGDGSRSVPVFITEYPYEVSPLARRNDGDPRWVDRFELFVEGQEIANAFSELNDPDDQAARFLDQVERAQGGDEEAMAFDGDYIRALFHGMPPAAGFGLGVDRTTMLLCGQPSIRDVLLFPLMKPEERRSDDSEKL